MNSSQREGLALVLMAAAGYACLPIFAKWAYAAGLEPLDLVTWRFIIAMPLIWLAVLATRKPLQTSPHQRWQMLGAGGLFALLAMTAFIALTRLPSSTYIVLLYTYPAMVAVLSQFLGERLEPRGWLALLMTLAGVLLTVPQLAAGFGQMDVLGIGLGLLNATLYSLYILLSSRLLRGQQALTEAGAWSISGSLVVLVAWVAVRGGLAWPTNNAAWGSVLGLAIVSTAIPIFAFYGGIARLGAARAAILSTIEPLLTLVLAVALLDETMTTQQWFGGLLIVFSVVLLQIRRPARSLGQGELAYEREMVAVPAVEDAHR